MHATDLKAGTVTLAANKNTGFSKKRKLAVVPAPNVPVSSFVTFDIKRSCSGHIAANALLLGHGLSH